MAAPASTSVEHATMIDCFDMLISGVSVDPLVITNKLVESGLVPPKLVSTMLLPSRDNYDKATELVLQVTTVVESSPAKFEVFVRILNNFMWLDDLVESMNTRYKANKQTAQEDTPDGDTLISLIPERGLREKVLEKNQLTREINTKNKELANLMVAMKTMQATMISLHETNIRNTEKREELEAELKKRERVYKEKIRLKEKEIEYLKNQLSLVNEKIEKEKAQRSPRIPSASPSQKEIQIDPPDAGLEAVRISTNIPVTSTTKKTHLKRDKTRRMDYSKTKCMEYYYYWCFASIFCLTLIVASLSTKLMEFTSPKRNPAKSGALTVGNSVVLTSRFDHSVKEVLFTQKDGLLPVEIYQGSCSTIRQFSQVGYNTKRLQLLVPSRHRIDEPYMTWDSRISYTIVVSDPDYDQVSTPCIAKVYIFKDKFDYYQFIVFGSVRRSFSSKCLSPANFTLYEYTGYYFLGLENFHPTILNITINSYKVQYNVTSLSSTVFSSKYKTVQLHHTSGQDMCVLAASKDHNTFISLKYYAEPKSDQYIYPRIALVYCTYTTLILLSFMMCCRCISKSKPNLRFMLLQFNKKLKFR